MCLCVQTYRRNKADCLDKPAPASNVEKAETESNTSYNRGLNYVAVRTCDLERFSAR